MEYYDYISPNFEKLDPSAAFPNLEVKSGRWMMVDEVTRNDPHLYRCDKKYPYADFVNVDEAHILHNLAKQVAGKPALEIGCMTGYSSWHLLQGGVVLSICDPVLSSRKVFEYVNEALSAFNGQFTLLGGESPKAVQQLGSWFSPWSLVFIDGNHEAPWPTVDAIAASHYCADDAMVVFHDLLFPPVFNAVVVLAFCGWKVKLYDTFQGMAVCYRGGIEPVYHTPDPAIAALPKPKVMQHLWDMHNVE